MEECKMAQFDIKQADNYGGSMQGGFFGLKNDKDSAQVRFMYESIDDVTGYSVHEVDIDGKKRYVNCLREYNEPMDKCPLCQQQEKLIAKMFIPLYNLDTQEVQVWDRGKNFVPTITSLCTRYNPLVSTPIEIERNGKRGDRETTYMTYPLQSDEVMLKDLPELPDVLGTIVLDKPYDDLIHYLQYGEFPAAQQQERQPANDAPQRRQAPQQEQQMQRRTPATVRPAPGTDGTPIDQF